MHLTFLRRTCVIRGLFKSLRPKQWTKNGFIFAPLIFDEKLFQWGPLFKTILGFFLLCLISGTVYLINDLVDIEKDRQHPVKKNRPIPSGQLPIPVAIAAVVILLIICLPMSFLLDPIFGLIITGYLILQIAYSFILKNMVIIDVMTIAVGFVLRVASGVPLVQAERFSPWLYVFTVLLALFLGLGKRRQELVLLNGQSTTRTILNQYNLPFLDSMMSIVTTGTIITYAFYTFSAPNLPSNHLMMLTIPFVIYGIFRYLYIIHVQGNGGAPDEVLLTDMPLQFTLVLFMSSVFFILYLFD
ncbi:MAG: decaprenyl-phosphate phosphoribosyltransferase [Anaerolineales bacterium]|nr:decaprenyl-phosphate phosphoribosyltransferase [Anaerolineales bacterium]